jgi:ABC-type histidine transport system ATPase subunit
MSLDISWVSSSLGLRFFDLTVSFLDPDNVIGPNGLLSTKARIVVTNSVAYLMQFDHAMYLRRGVVVETGPIQVLLSNPESETSKTLYVPFCSKECSQY